MVPAALVLLDLWVQVSAGGMWYWESESYSRADNSNIGLECTSLDHIDDVLGKFTNTCACEQLVNAVLLRQETDRQI